MQKLGSSMDYGQEAILGLAAEGLPDLMSALPEAAASLPQPPSIPVSAAPAKATSNKKSSTNDLMPPPELKAIYGRVAAEEGVPVNILVAMGHTESRHRADIDGPQTKYGAAGGIMQYLPGMAAAHKINRYNAEESVRQAAKDLRERLAKNKGDMANAVARHHAGDNPEQLGPKSRDYAETILAKARRLAPAYEAEQAAQLKTASQAREASREQAAEAKRSEYYPQGGAASAPAGRTWLQAGGDTLAQLAEGVNTIAGAPADLIAPDSDFAQFFRDGADYWRSAQSEDMQRRIAQSDKRISQAGEDGLLAQMAAAASEYTNDPALAARLVATNAASLIPGVAVAKLAQAAAIARGATAARAAAAATTAAGGANAVLNAGGARGEAYQDLRQTLIAKGMTPEAATEIALRESLPSAAAGGLAGFLSGKIGLEKALAGQGGAGLRGAAGAAAAELAGEQVEEVAPQITTNLMAGQHDGRSLLKNVGRTIVETGLASGPGAVVSAGVAHGPVGRAVSKARVLESEQVAPAGTDLYHDVVGDQMFEGVGLSQHEDITPHQEDVIGPNMPAWGHQPAAELAGQPIEVGRKENFAADYPVPPAPDAAAIADVDARVAAAREQESAAQRRQILDGVLSDSAVRNPVAKFAAELARAGYAQPMPGADELATIERFSAAKDTFAAIDPDTPPQAPAAPNAMGDDDAVDWRAQRDAEIMGEAEGDGLAQPDQQNQPAQAGQAMAQGGEAAKPSTPQGFTPEQAAIADQSRAANQFIKLLRKAGQPVTDERAMVALWKAHKANATGQQGAAPAVSGAQPAVEAAQPAPSPEHQQPAVAAKPPKQKNWHKKAAQVDIERDTVRDAVARLGGIRKDEAMREWGATLVEGTKSRIFGKPVFRTKGGTGMPLDKMREALAELGYLEPDSDINDLYQAFEQDGLHHVGQERRAEAMAQQAATESQAAPAGAAAAAAPERTLDNHPVYDPWYDFDPDAILPDDLNEAAANAGDVVSDEDAEMFQAITTRLHQVLGSDEAEAIAERAAIMADSGKNFFEAVLELINGRQEAEGNAGTAEPVAAGRKSTEAPTGPSGARSAPDVQQGQPDAGRAPAEAGQPGDGDAGILQSYDQAELDTREQAQRAAEARRQEEERAADRKRQADAEVGDFVLSGSDSIADQLAARGQGGLFDEPSGAPDTAGNARQSRLSNEPTASAASRIPAASGQGDDSRMESDDGVLGTFPDGARLSLAKAEAAPVVDQLDAARSESAAAAQATPATDEGRIDAGVSRNDRSESGEARRITVEDARAIVGRILANVSTRTRDKVRVVPSVAMLPPEVRQWLDKEVNQDDHDIPAVYWNGNTYIIAENLRSEAHLEEALLHELMGHYGVRVLFGAETDVKLRQLFEDIGGWKGYLNIADALGLTQRLMPYYLDFKDSQRLNFVMMDELLGHMAGLKNWPLKPLHVLIGRLKAYLRKMGFKSLPAQSTSDLAALLAKAQSMVIAGDDRANPVEKSQRASLGAASIPALIVADLQEVFRQSPLSSWVDRLIASGRLTIKPNLVLPEGYKHLEATQAFTVDGNITMFAGNIGGRQRVMPVLLHEVFHSSGEALLGGKEWGKLIAELDQLRQHAESNPAGKAGKLWNDAKRRVQEAIDNGDNMSQADMAEELGAYAIELADQAPLTWQRWVDRLIGHVKAWARRVFGVQLGRLTPEQLRALAIAALREGSTTANPGQRLSMRDKEVISMKEGNFPGAKDGQLKSDLRGEKNRESAERNQDSYADASAAQGVKINRAAVVVDEAGRYAVKSINALRTTWGVVSDYQKSIPAIRDAYDLQGAMDGRRIGIATEASKSFGRDFSSMAIKDPATADKLADLMTQATLWQIHPDQPQNERWHAKWKNKHAELSAKWDALPEEAKQLYSATQKFYAARSDDIQNALKERIMGLDVGEKQKRDILAELQTRFDRELGAGPYFPLARFGSYLVIGVKGEGENAQRVVMNAEYAPEAYAMADELRKRGYQVTNKAAKEQAQEQDMRQSSELMRKVAEMIETQVPDLLAAPMLDELNQIFLDVLPLASARKSFIHRKNVAGYSRDMARALNQSAVKLAGQISKLEYAQKIEDAFLKAENQAADSPDSFDLQPVVSEMRKRFDSTMKFKTHPVAAALQQAGFAFTLAYNLSSAAVNLLQMAIAGGHMGARHGAVKANAQIAKALREIATTARQRDKNAHIFDLRKTGSQLSAGEKKMLEELEQSGKIDVTAAMDAYRAAHEDTKRIAESRMGRVVQKVFDGMGVFMQAAEVVNRQAVALAAYRMELQKNDGNTSAAIRYASEVLDDTQFNMNISNQPRFMHQNWARVVMQYKGFAINMMDYLGRTMRTAMDGMDKDERRQATKALGLIFGTQVALAGIGSLPMYMGAAAAGARAGKMAATVAGGGAGARNLGAVLGGGAAALALAAFLNGAFGDDDEPWDWKADMRRWLAQHTNATLAQFIDRGLFSIAGVDIADRISMNGLILRDLQEQHGKKAWESMAEDAVLGLGGVALSKFYLSAARAMDALEQGKTKDAFVLMMPVTLSNAVKGTDMAVNGVTDKRTGAKLMDVNAGEALVQMFGFQSSAVRERRWADNVAYGADRQMQDRKSSLLDAIAKAVRADDDKAEDTAWEMADRWNDKNGDLYNPITQRDVNNRVRQMDDQQATKEGEARTSGQRKQLERKEFYQKGLGQ